MFENFSPTTMLAIKKYAYWLWLLLALSMPFNYWMAQDSAHPAFWAFSLVIAVFGIGPLLDMLFGRDPANPDEETQTPQLLGQGYYVLLTLATVPVLIGTLVWAAGVFVAFQEWGWLGRLGWILSMGTVMGAVGIVVAHELIHKDSALEQAAGGILLAAVCYAGFKVEHVRGHHVHVSTPEDASSARFGQSVYQFLPHAYKYNFLNAWRLEAVRLRKKGLPVFGWQNELIGWYLLSLALLVGFGWAFGWLGMVFFLGQAFVAVTLLEIINYVEHYGLHRRKGEDGRYERTNHTHSWNSNFVFTNLVLFHLQRHSDHHAFAKRPYQALRHYDDSPQMPSGYAGMVVLALIPPLWRAVMDPKVRAYYAGEEFQLTAEQSERPAAS
ncbi:TPA: alkane 1-monooxygenase [Pseudomonas aeruginosa]|uniref:alkane 1-monooxygenase AlkB1 n=1 Tax=Pseudomonas aeruginosa TaxID=287 RepID=UPI00053D324E|nr:alkane 1-monooxygenase AlkB1 [Pseudomonas aeruginosa]AON06832.1 alkane 1-monooxygenase [Pseudomonas aeruginosa]AON12821.1 alkane 1-monooxygenase [Pseudomonas aeruginosa]AON18807.1 alkane 1-monooxygenase [Pseudomonas aeruginosa]AON25330.1 alkane 1-monooxygenase [Pseudomonas aeruginosa]AON30803.1 alkane 1-monooxygenase [Pseudomonas aeruginosa]